MAAVEIPALPVVGNKTPNRHDAALHDGRAEELAKELSRKIKGEVRFDSGSRALYATDLSIYRQVPIGVVIPRDAEDVMQTVEACRKRDVPILGRGCGTSLAGQTCNVAVIIDFSKYMNRILDLDPRRKMARVEPGLIRDQLNAEAERHHLTFAPDPATHQYCTLGGMIGNNSCGVHSVMGGKTVDNVEELEILTYDGVRMRVGPTRESDLEQIIHHGGRRGEIYGGLRSLRDKFQEQVRKRYPQIPRRVSGYNLDELLPERGFNVARALVGSESTCVLVLSAKLRLIDSPPARAILVIAYPDMFLAGDDTAAVRSLGCIGLEAFQKHVIENMGIKGNHPEGARLLPDGDTWLIAEFGGETREEAESKAHDGRRALERRGGGQIGMRVIGDPAEQHQAWHIRESGVGASRVPGVEDAWPSWEDAAVAPEVLGRYLRDFHKLLQKFRYRWTLYGHFGDGCVHTRITFDLKSTQGVKQFRQFMTEAADLVVHYGGSLSGEHGDGQARAELLPKMFGSELVEAFREFKSIWDPHWRMNPGKLVDAYKLDSNLRLGPDYRPTPVATHFQFPEDHGSFASATERCFGVGKCRGLDGGTMCPSFMATREEMHSTRGRAHLLFEMLRGDAIRDGWHDEHVKEALDLCLACKGCKGDCPVSVDLATYKAEFLSHYYEGRSRPAAAYALGFVDRWAELGSLAPHFANLVAHAPVLSGVVKSFAGLAHARPVPSLASTTFRDWFRSRRSSQRGKSLPADAPSVVLWADTFNNYFLPHTARAAVDVLESAGYRVEVPNEHVCCGRPLYDYGMLDEAKKYLLRNLRAIAPAVSRGLPIIVLEPSCLAVFRDEMCNLLPDNQDAQQLRAQSFLLGEFLDRTGYRPPKLRRKVMLHGHCHQKALVGVKSEQELLSKMGVELETLDSGCCGMAGSFGYEEDHYDVSMKVGERSLLPKVRGAPKDTIILADGFSCREQIAQNTRRRALHLSELLYMARQEGPDGPAGAYPEKKYASISEGASVGVPLLLAGVAVAAGLMWYSSRQSK